MFSFSLVLLLLLVFIIIIIMSSVLIIILYLITHCIEFVVIRIPDAYLVSNEWDADHHQVMN